MAPHLAAATVSCTEPSAEDRALATEWAVHVDRPATGEPFFAGKTRGQLGIGNDAEYKISPTTVVGQ